MSLEGLADELLLEILDYVSIRNRWDIDFKTWAGNNEIDSRVRTLHNVSLVSRRLYRVANHVLYNVLVDGAVAARRRQFIQTAVRRPDLAALVKEARFAYFDWHDTINFSGIPLEDEYSEIHEAAKTLDIGNERERASFQRDLTQNFNSADVALLFSQLPGLETLEFEVDETWFHTWKWFLCLARRTAEKGSGPLSSLRHLRPRYGNENASGFNPLFIQDFVGLPSLKTIEMSGTWFGERDGDRDLSLQSNSRIETLAFWKSCPGNAFIESALKAFTQLKAFRFTYGSFPAVATSYAETQEFHRVLSTRSDTLEHVSILVSDGCGVFREMARRSFVVPRFGSLKAFTRLKRLEITEAILSGMLDTWDDDFGTDPPLPVPTPDYSELVDILPASLESLVIQCDVSVCTESSATHKTQFLLALARHVADLPTFRRLELLMMGEYHTKQTFLEDLERLVELTHDLGFEFEIVGWDQAKHEGLPMV